jgi:hypothetical protein
LAIILGGSWTAQAEVIGRSSTPSTDSAAIMVSYTANVAWYLNDTAQAGTLDSADVFCLTVLDQDDSLRIVVYDKGATVGECDSVASTGPFAVTQTGTPAWKQVAISGTLVANTPYIISVIPVAGSESNLRLYGYVGTWGDCKTKSPVYVQSPPATLTGFTDNTGIHYGLYVKYTPTGGGAGTKRFMVRK